MSTVSKTNMNEIPDIIDEVVKAKVKVFAFSRYVPTGGEVDTSMTPQEYRKLLEICDAKYGRCILHDGKYGVTGNRIRTATQQAKKAGQD